MSVPSQPATASRLRSIASEYFVFSRFQLMLLAIGLAVVGTFWLFQGHMALQDVVGPLIFTLVVGNSTNFSSVVTAPFYAGRSFPWDVFLLLSIIIPASIASGYLASVVTRFVLQPDAEHLFDFSPLTS